MLQRCKITFILIKSNIFLIRFFSNRQANVALNLQPKQSISSEQNEEGAQNSETKIRRTDNLNNDSSNLYDTVAKEEIAAQQFENSKSNDDSEMKIPSSNDGNQIKEEMSHENETKMDISPSVSPSQEKAQELEKEDEDSGEVHIVSSYLLEKSQNVHFDFDFSVR